MFSVGLFIRNASDISARPPLVLRNKEKLLHFMSMFLFFLLSSCILLFNMKKKTFLIVFSLLCPQLQSTIREHRDGGNAGGVFSQYNIIKVTPPDGN